MDTQSKLGDLDHDLAFVEPDAVNHRHMPGGRQDAQGRRDMRCDLSYYDRGCGSAQWGRRCRQGRAGRGLGPGLVLLYQVVNVGGHPRILIVFGGNKGGPVGADGGHPRILIVFVRNPGGPVGADLHLSERTPGATIMDRPARGGGGRRPGQ